MHFKSNLLVAGTGSAVVGGTGITLAVIRPWSNDSDIGTGISAIDPPKSLIKYENENKLRSQGCSKQFFPGVTIQHDAANNTANSTTKSDFLAPIPSENGDSSKVIGCTSMQLAYKEEKSDDYPSFTVQAEVAVRNDKVGVIAWAGGHLHTSPTPLQMQTIQYRVIFLEHESNGWKVRGGYTWNDAKLTEISFTMNISGPDGVWVKYDNKETWKNRRGRSYIGVWKSQRSGKSIFKDIYVSSVKEGEDAEFFGSSNLNFESSSNRGYKSVDQKYVRNTWVTYSAITGNDSSGFDISPILKKWYAPFAGSLGEWIEVGEYCGRRSNESSEGYNLFCKKTEV